MVKRGSPMKTLAIMSQKGGSGKTTLAVHLAAYAVGQKIKAALIDLDPQASAYKWNERRTEHDPKSPKLDTIKGTVTQLPGFLQLAEEARAALEGQGITVLPSAIHQRAAYSHAVIDGRAVHEYEPKGKAAEEISGLYGNISRLLGIHTRNRKAIA